MSQNSKSEVVTRQHSKLALGESRHNSNEKDVGTRRLRGATSPSYKETDTFENEGYKWVSKNMIDNHMQIMIQTRINSSVRHTDNCRFVTVLFLFL